MKTKGYTIIDIHTRRRRRRRMDALFKFLT